jgi:predicted ATPase
MPSLIPDFQYDVFISYRHKDNKGDQWVSGFVNELKIELESTFKENVSVYFDTNPHDGISDHHDVDLSLREKVKSLIFIPIISQTYCDTKGFAWKNEFIPFNEHASKDRFGLKIKVANGNVTSRILPVRIHELEAGDISLLEKELGGILRAIDFTFTSPGVNRPLTRTDKHQENSSRTVYRDQINKVANAVKEIVDALKSGTLSALNQSKPKDFLGLYDTIPVPATELFGREREVGELIALLRENRLVSIIGSGGMGKTRLALELCHGLREEFSGNVVFTSMAALTSVGDVIPALANALGVKDAEGRDLRKGISSVIGDRKVMLVLDNLEQVIDVAPQIAELIASCLNLRILTTSRTPLKVRAEREYVLNTLSRPDDSFKSIERLITYPSISLFVDRVRKVSTNFQLSAENATEVVQICQRLDGLPLALELAAARTRMMSTKQLLQKLEHALDVLTAGAKDLPQRHQTLRGTIDWSHSLLTESEQVLFRRLAVFPGGFTEHGIMEVCSGADTLKALDELESLVDKALVLRVESTDRFMMLQTIKEYAIEKLDAASETREVRFRQARYALKIARQVRDELENGQQLISMKNGIQEESNLQSALDFLLSEARRGNAEATELGMAICGQLYLFWHIRGKHIMARQYSNSFINMPNCPAESHAKCWCLNTVGLASSTLGQHEQSIVEHKAAYEMAEKLGEMSAMGFALLSMFIAYLGIGKVAEADDCVKGYLPLSLKTGNDFEIGFSNTADGIMHSVKGELDLARISFNKALEIQDKIPDLEGGGLSLGGLALLASIGEKFAESIELYQASLDKFARIGDRAEEARILEEMAWVFLKSGNAIASRKHFLDCIRAYEDVGSVRGIGLALLGIAGVESVEGRPANSIQIATAAQLFTEQEGIVNNYGEGFQGKIFIDQARNSLSPVELNKAVAFGKRMSLNYTLKLAGRS